MPETTITITEAAMTRLCEAEQHVATLAGVLTATGRDTGEVLHLATTFIHSLRTLLGIGGSVYLESDTMLIAVGPSGYTVGMHYDKRRNEWSVHS